MENSVFVRYLVPVLYLWLVSTIYIHSIECSVSACHIAILPPYLSAAASAASGRGPARPCSLPSRLSRSDGSPGNRAAAGVGAVSISTQVSISLDTVNQSTVGVGMAELQRDS